MTDLNKLAEQIEQAKPEQQREMLEMAFAALFPEPSRGTWTQTMSIQQAIKDPVHEAAITAHSYWRRHIRGRFYGLLSWDAFTDAAIMFVPRGWVIGEMSWWPCSDSSTVHMDDRYNLKACSGATRLPLALTAAALRAHAAKGGR